MDKQEAEVLWNRLHDGLIDVEKTLIEIIKNKAWEPLGYPTFKAAWDDRLSDCKIANSNGPIRAVVVYAFLDEGLSDEEIIKTAKIPDARVAGIREAKVEGVPAERAYGRTKVIPVTPGKGFMRSYPEPRAILEVPFASEAEVEAMRDGAAQYGFDLKTWAADVIRNAFERRINAVRKIAS